ncbi:hypothetical protein [Psychrobacter sp. P11G5]|uniref:hypothetical protein n=1 Tax=Psychrobacter sp. P11G5 TaxID=1699624 RepID=UPI00078D8DED|nr:hypothetical protein [Psychrobacter sp. P11G5]AMN69048.1 hypothetical protein AK825_14420 [Psychrobacter sp. P11G5]
MRFLPILVIIFLSITNVSAGVFQNLDRQLLEAEIVDKNYKYIDEAEAYELFRYVSNTVASMLPIKLNSYTEAEAVLFTPYVGNYFYKIDMLLTDENKDLARREFTNVTSVRNLCESLYDAKFQRANNFTLNLVYNDIEGKNIARIKLNRSTCP